MIPLDPVLHEELRRKEFRVSIFGSARISEGTDIYQDTFELAHALGEMGVDVVTGGGPGLMEAASRGHQAGKKDPRVTTIGLNIELPFEQKPNPSLDMVQHHEHFSSRLDEFMLFSNAVVVMPGGIGTCLELFYTWQLLQVKHICRMPIILVGGMWKELLEWVKKWPLHYKNMDAEDMNYVIAVRDAKEALEVLKATKKAYEEQGEEVCLNWQIYGGLVDQAEPKASM